MPAAAGGKASRAAAGGKASRAAAGGKASRAAAGGKASRAAAGGKASRAAAGGKASRAAAGGQVSDVPGVSAGLLASAAPARAASTSQARGHAQCRPGSPGPLPGVIPAMGRPQVIIWEAGHGRSC